jgi:hypothetical protein
MVTLTVLDGHPAGPRPFEDDLPRDAIGGDAPMASTVAEAAVSVPDLEAVRNGVKLTVLPAHPADCEAFHSRSGGHHLVVPAQLPASSMPTSVPRSPDGRPMFRPRITGSLSFASGTGQLGRPQCRIPVTVMAPKISRSPRGPA